MTKFNGQEWKDDSILAELTFLLTYPPLSPAGPLWTFDLWFVPGDYVADEMAGHDHNVPRLLVSFMGRAPEGCGWKDLEGVSIEPTEEEPLSVDAHFWLQAPDGGAGQTFDSTACQVRFLRREGWKFQVEVSAWLSRAGSLAAQLDEIAAGLSREERRAKRDAETWDERKDFYWLGEVQFTQVNFAAPINAPNPKKLAEDVTRQVLKMDIPAFRQIYINYEHTQGITPQTGITPTGHRVVMLELPY